MSLFRWALSAVCLTLVLYVARRVDWDITLVTTRRASLVPLVAATMANFLSVILRGARWWIFLRRVGECSLALAVRGAIVGSGLNNFVVANGGEAARVLLVSRASGISRASVLATLALERAFDPQCFGLLLFTATFLVPLPARLVALRPIAGIALLAASASLVVLTRAPDKCRAKLVTTGWRKHVLEFRSRVRSLASVRRFLAAFAVSISVWTLQVTKMAVVASALHLGLPVGGSIAAMLLINTGLLVRATPGNLGYFQLAYAMATSRFGVATEAAVGAAMLIQAIEIVPVTIAALALAPGMLRSEGHPTQLHTLYSPLSALCSRPTIRARNCVISVARMVRDSGR